MTQNPFGEGGLDMNALLQQAQQMQEQLVAAQESLAETEVEGTAGGVTVKLNGTGDLLSVDISAGTFDGSDAESLTDLGDLVVAAWRDAKARVDATAAEKLGPLAGGAEGGLGGLGGGLGGPGESGGPSGLPGGPGF